MRHAADGTDRLSKLEDQMLTWTGDGDSPDRIDAFVHGLTALMLPDQAKDTPAVRPTQQRWSGMRGR